MTLAALFSPDDAEEYRARLRSLRLGARVLCGERARVLEMALHDAEQDHRAIPHALAALDH
jgi:hypothetical protein